MINHSKFLQSQIILVMIIIIFKFINGIPVTEDEHHETDDDLQKVIATIRNRLQNARDSMNDYYAKRDAVMEKIHARQRESKENRKRWLEKSMQNGANINRNSDSESQYDPDSINYNFNNTTIRKQFLSHRRGDIPIESTENNVDTNKFRIGSCRGFVIYRHNVKITGIYQALTERLVDVNIQGICITCVEVLPQNNKKANITITSGGPNAENVAIKFNIIDEENADFTVKVWALLEHCSVNSLK